MSTGLMALWLFAAATITEMARSADDDAGAPLSESGDSEPEPEPDDVEDVEDDDRDESGHHAIAHLCADCGVSRERGRPHSPASLPAGDHPLAEPPTPPPRA